MKGKISPKEAERVHRVTRFTNVLHDYLNDLYEHMVDKDWKKAKAEAQAIIDDLTLIVEKGKDAFRE